MKLRYINKYILLILLLLLSFGVYMQWSVSESTRQLKNDEIEKSKQYAANIAAWIMKKSKGEIESTLRSDPTLQKELSEMLETFVIPKYAYIFLLKQTPKGHYRFLLDGSKAEEKERFGTLFFPQNKQFDEVYKRGQVKIIKQEDDVKGVWLSLLYPLRKENRTQALLVLDLSKWYGKSLESYNSPLQSLLWLMQIFLLFSFIFLSVIFYRYYQFRKSILTDRLTGAQTKRYLEEFFLSRKMHDYHALIVDIDEFKEVNRNFGYESGDEVLKEFVRTLAQQLPKESVIIRTGGAEFSLFFPKQYTLEEIAQKLFIHMRQKRYLVKNHVIQMNISITGMEIPPETKDIQHVLRILDEEMLKVKSQGKNSIALVDLQSDQEIKYRQIDYIKRALEEERLVCLYQPIFKTKTGEIKKYEVLVRLVDEEDTSVLIPPGRFLSAIKGTSYYIKMSKLVLSQVFRVLEAYPDIELSVNLDLDDLHNMDMMQMIMDYLSKNRAYAGRLTFEILEENEIRDYSRANFIFTQLKAYGSKIAIDDFGSGYSNYNYLIQLDIDILKIDGSLIKELRTTPKRAEVVISSIKLLAETFGYELVAEFVANETVYEAVKALEIDYVQGHYLGEPKPIEAYLEQTNLY